MANIDLKQAIKAKRLYHYEVAEALGISEYTLCVVAARARPRTQAAN